MLKNFHILHISRDIAVLSTNYNFFGLVFGQQLQQQFLIDREFPFHRYMIGLYMIGLYAENFNLCIFSADIFALMDHRSTILAPKGVKTYFLFQVSLIMHFHLYIIYIPTIFRNSHILLILTDMSSHKSVGFGVYPGNFRAPS